MRVLRRLDPWLPPLLLMGIVFAFSAQPDLNSGLGTIDAVGRKLLHFLEYGLLTFLWWRVISRGTSSGRAALIALLIASAYAASDEYHQTFVEGRSGSPLDWLIDTGGAGLAAWLLRRRSRSGVVS